MYISANGRQDPGGPSQAHLVSISTLLVAPLTFSVLSKKYTEDHEWIEMDADGKIGTFTPAPLAPC